VLSLPFICIGKVILGIYCGINTVIGPRIINEVVPETHLAFYGVLTGILTVTG
jgi:hypothetical protein